jgi:hypothetical protein
MKKHKSMIILLGVFCVLIASYFIITAVNKSKEKNAQATMVTDMVNVVALDYQTGDTKVSFVKEKGVWQVKGKPDLALEASMMKEMVEGVKKIEAIRVLQGIDDLKDYGLEEPTYTITLQEDTGKKVTFYIGNATGENYYAATGLKELVYTVSGSVVEALKFDVSGLKDAMQ